MADLNPKEMVLQSHFLQLLGEKRNHETPRKLSKRNRLIPGKQKFAQDRKES